MKGDNVGIALHDHGVTRRGHGRLRLIEPVKHLRFMKDGGLLRVEVLRLALSYHAPAESDAIALDVGDGKHHAVEEPIAQAPVTPARGDVGLDHLLRAEASGAQMPNERAFAWGETELPQLRNRPPQPAARQVRARSGGIGSRVAHELGMVELRRDLADLLQAGLLARRRAATARLDDVDMSSLGELAHGLGKREILCFHEEGEHVTAFAASEAVPQLKRGVDLKRRALLVMKRATAPEVAPALLHRGSLPDDRDDVARLAHAPDVLIADKTLCQDRATPSPHTFNRAPPPIESCPIRSRTRINFRRFRERDAPSTVERPHLPAPRRCGREGASTKGRRAYRTHVPRPSVTTPRWR